MYIILLDFDRNRWTLNKYGSDLILFKYSFAYWAVPLFIVTLTAYFSAVYTIVGMIPSRKQTLYITHITFHRNYSITLIVN